MEKHHAWSGQAPDSWTEAFSSCKETFGTQGCGKSKKERESVTCLSLSMSPPPLLEIKFAQPCADDYACKSWLSLYFPLPADIYMARKPSEIRLISRAFCFLSKSVKNNSMTTNEKKAEMYETKNKCCDIIELSKLIGQELFNKLGYIISNKCFCLYSTSLFTMTKYQALPITEALLKSDKLNYVCRTVCQNLQ